MKTFIVEWFNKTRNGAWRNYKKVVQTDDIKSYVKDKMKLVVSCQAFGHYKGTFASATEVSKINKIGADYQTVENGQYWYGKDGEIICSKCKWLRFYDHKLTCWF